MYYEVIIENIGRVYSGYSKGEAIRIYTQYTVWKNEHEVTLLENGEIIKEFFPINELSTVDN